VVMSGTDSQPDFADGTAGVRKLIAIVYADMVGYSRLTGYVRARAKGLSWV
jgi:class 3 adenylate cyclase